MLNMIHEKEKTLLWLISFTPSPAYQAHSHDSNTPLLQAASFQGNIKTVCQTPL